MTYPISKITAFHVLKVLRHRFVEKGGYPNRHCRLFDSLHVQYSRVEKPALIVRCIGMPVPVKPWLRQFRRLGKRLFGSPRTFATRRCDLSGAFRSICVFMIFNLTWPPIGKGWIARSECRDIRPCSSWSIVF